MFVFFYLEMLAAPKNHILQHDISARNPGTEPQSRERATEGDSLQGKGADHTFLNGEEGDYHREKKIPEHFNSISKESFIYFSQNDKPRCIRDYFFKVKMNPQTWGWKHIAKMLKNWERKKSLFWWVSENHQTDTSVVFG